MKTKNWEELTFADNFMFCMILEHNPDICRKLLELLLHIKIEKLEVPEAERTLQQDYDSKSVRFDVYTKDENRIFDLEEAVHDMAARLLTKKKKLPAKKALLKAPAEHVSRLHGSCLQNKSRWRPYSSAPAFQKKRWQN